MKTFMKIACLVFGFVVLNVSAGHERTYGSTTSYEDSIKLWNVNTSFQEPGCTPVLFTLYSRHASRNPSMKSIRKFQQTLVPLASKVIENIASGKSSLNKAQFERWNVSYTSEDAEQLVHLGDEEMFEIGQRYKSRFPDLLKSSFNPKFHDVIHTTKNRTRDTAKAFLRAIFGTDEVEMQVKNELLRFYKTCKNWKAGIDDNSTTRIEKQRFMRSRVFQHMLKDISIRLGFLEESNRLTAEQVEIMFDACSYDYTTKTDRFSPWCHAFEQDDIDVMEYVDDLEHYWPDSYGHKLNYEQACPPVKDLLHHIRMATQKNTEKTAILRFTHQGFMQKFYARLGLFKEKRPLTASWWSSSAPYEGQESLESSKSSSSEQSTSSSSSSSSSSEENNSNIKPEFDIKDRQYRLSKHGPFAANIAFVMYKCPSYQIKVFVQENEVHIPGCSRPMCHLNEFLSLYTDIAQNCDMNKICNG